MARQGRDKRRLSGVWGSGGCRALGWHSAVLCWDRPVQEGKGTLLGPGTAKALGASLGGCRSHQHLEKRPGSAMQGIPGVSHLEIVLRCRSHPVGALQSCVGHTRSSWHDHDKGWSHVGHELTLVPQQHQVWSVLHPPRCWWGHPGPVNIFPQFPAVQTVAASPQKSHIPVAPTIPWAPQRSGAGCNPEGSQRVQHHQ